MRVGGNDSHSVLTWRVSDIFTLRLAVLRRHRIFRQVVTKLS